MKQLAQSFVILCCLLLFVAGCTQETTAVPLNRDKVVMKPDPANPSNVIVTITFLNPQKTSEPNVLINYDTLVLRHRVNGVETNSFLPLLPGPTNGTSVCSFSLPQTEATNFTVGVAGCDNKPVGEAHVVRKIKLGDPNQ
jgi:hypothetical protein